MKKVYRCKGRRAFIPIAFLLLTMAEGCYKYQTAPQISNPAYLRVFNAIPYTVDALHAGQQVPFLCMLIDPVFDRSNVPVSGAVVGDWLHTRELFSLSYASSAGTALDAQEIQNINNPNMPAVNITNANYEYPGKMHVLTAPAMNGIDMSAWAQVASGKHRFVFITRPLNDTPFGDLIPTLRNNVIIDTTLDLKAGEVYTINTLSTDIDNNKFGAYMRQEQFTRKNFDPGRIYASFYNLSGIRPYLATDPKYPLYWYFTDTLSIKYSYWINDDNFNGSQNLPSRTLPGVSNVYFSTIIRGKEDAADFVPLPFLTRDYFFDQQGVLRRMANMAVNNSAPATMPYVTFDFAQTSPQAAIIGHFPTLLCTADPASFNTIDPNTVNNSLGNNTGSPNSFMYQPNLNRVIQSGSSLNIIPTINIFEIIYNHIYLMQLQRGFEKVPL